MLIRLMLDPETVESELSHDGFVPRFEFINPGYPDSEKLSDSWVIEISGDFLCGWTTEYKILLSMFKTLDIN